MSKMVSMLGLVE